MLGVIVQRIEAGIAPDAIDRLESPGRHEPGARVRGYALAGSLLECRAKGVVQRLFREIEVSEKAHKRGEHAARLGAIDGIDRLARARSSLKFIVRGRHRHNITLRLWLKRAARITIRALMSRQLFRQEAIDAQREKFLGEATIARPVPFWVFTVLAAGIAILLIGVALWGQYTRRERVEGYIALDTGAARVLIPDSGRVTELLIKEGDEVKAGDEMARISLDRSTGSSASPSEAVAAEQQNRREMLEKEQAQWRDLGSQQVEQLRRRMKDLEIELTQIDREMKLQEVRIKSAREQVERYKGLAGEKQFVSEALVKQKQDEVTDQEIKLQTLRRQRGQVERDLAAARLEEPSLALRSRTQVEQVSRQLSELREGMAQTEARRETVIRAPMAGGVTHIAVNRGQSIPAA